MGTPAQKKIYNNYPLVTMHHIVTTPQIEMMNGKIILKNINKSKDMNDVYNKAIPHFKKAINLIRRFQNNQ